MAEWMDMASAPRDGSWIILECESGGHIWSAQVGRFRPMEYETGIYQWETIDVGASTGMDETAPLSFSHYEEGATGGWLPLPASDKSAADGFFDGLTQSQEALITADD